MPRRRGNRRSSSGSPGASTTTPTAGRGRRGAGARNQPVPMATESPSSGESGSEAEEMEVDSNHEAQDAEEEEEEEVSEEEEEEADSSDEEAPAPPQPTVRAGPSASASSTTPTEFVVDSSDPLIQTVRNAMEHTIQFVKEVIPLCTSDEKYEEVVDRLQKLMLGYIKTEASYIQGQRIVAKLGDELPQLGDNATEVEIITTTENFGKQAIEKVNENRSKIREDSLKKHKNYTRLLNEISKMKRKNDTGRREPFDQDGSDSESEEEDADVADLEDDDASEMIPITDPITKLPLTDPVRNSNCGHIYGKKAMTDLIRQNRKIRCTMAGCQNKAFVSVRHLISDPELTEKVKKKIAEAKTAAERRRKRRGGAGDTEEL